jgi:hypothetical protein
MNSRCKLVSVCALISLSACWANCEPSASVSIQTHEPISSSSTTDDSNATEARAEKRYNEMLGKMQKAVEEIAQLYGNPTFLQIFTNDVDQASELKNRLKLAQRLVDIRLEVEDLEKTRDELLSDIALRQREAGKLSEKLLRQRKTLASIAAALEQARNTAEDTVR